MIDRETTMLFGMEFVEWRKCKLTGLGSNSWFCPHISFFLFSREAEPQ